MTKIAVVIVNYNGWKDTLECLTSLSKSQIPNPKSQTIIIDNGSTNDSVKEIKRWLSANKEFPLTELVELKENKGFAGGNNVGIEFALQSDNDYVLLLNNDTLVDAEFLSRLIATAEADKQVGIVGPKIYFAKGYEFHKDRYKKSERGRVLWFAGGEVDWNNMYAEHRGVDEMDSKQFNKTEETDFVSGCCMLVKAKVFNEVGLLDDQLYLYLEDLDFCLRAEQAGYKIVYEPKAVIWHKNASSSDQPGSKLHQYYQTRNRLIVGMRYAPMRTRIALLRESTRFLRKNGIKRKAVKDFYLYNWGRADL